MSDVDCIAITGLDTDFGEALATRLLERPSPPRIVGVDLHRPLRLAGRIEFHEIDLTDPTADGQLATVLADEGVEAVAHMAFRSTPSADLEYDHELETIGSLHLMNAAGAAKVRRLVLCSSTMVYGPRPDNPNFLSEDRLLAGHPEAHCVENLREAEELAAKWDEAHPDAELTVLRRCWVMGPNVDDRVTRFFDRPVVPTLLGYDPLLQFVHEEAYLRVLEAAVTESHPGVFNVVGRGVLPLSVLLAIAGKRSLPLPTPLLYRLSDVPTQGQIGDPPGGFFDYLRYLWVAEGQRGWDEFGEPDYTTREAWISFVASRRLAGYG